MNNKLPNSLSANTYNSIFEFDTTENTYEIVGVKDKAITEITIPDFVTSIGLHLMSALI